MSKTKKYAVIIYNGKETVVFDTRAISINAAKAAGKEYIRDMHIAGGIVVDVKKR